MLAKSILTLEGVNAAAPMRIFASLNADGSLNYAETRGVVSVYCNKVRNVNGEEQRFSDLFELRVSGEANLRTIANHVYKGKSIDRITAFVAMPRRRTNENGETVRDIVAVKWDREKGRPARDPNNNYIPVDVPTFHVQSVELGADTESFEREKGTAALNAAIQQGNLHPETDPSAIMDIVMRSRRNKPKSKNWDLNEALRTGAFGHAVIWSKDKGNWQPNAQYKQTPASGNGPAAEGGMSPEELAEFYEFKRMKAEQASTQPKAQTAGATEGADAPSPVKDDLPEPLPEEGGYDEIPF